MKIRFNRKQKKAVFTELCVTANEADAYPDGFSQERRRMLETLIGKLESDAVLYTAAEGSALLDEIRSSAQSNLASIEKGLGGHVRLNALNSALAAYGRETVAIVPPPMFKVRVADGGYYFSTSRGRYGRVGDAADDIHDVLCEEHAAEILDYLASVELDPSVEDAKGTCVVCRRKQRKQRVTAEIIELPWRAKL